MISLGLKSGELDKLKALLITHHRISVDVQLLTLEHKYIGTLSQRLLGGQVTIDSEAGGATRSCNLELLDPLHQLNLDSDSPEDGSLYGNKMVKIIYRVISVDRQTAISIPIFCGPLTKVDRNGPTIQVEAQGKEILSMSSVWKGRDFKAGVKKTEVIRILMEEFGGEKRMDFAKSNAKIPKKMALSRENNAWAMARGIARSMNMQLFYDGRGVLRLRRNPNKTMYTFSQRGALLSSPQAGYDMTEAKNAVQVIGGKPKKAKEKITYREVAPRTHALSPWNLGRWGTPRYLPEVIEDDSIRSEKEAKAVAKARLKVVLVQAVEVSFDSLPIPMLEENDLCRVSSDQFSGGFKLKKMTIPLTADGTSSVGYLRRTSPKRRRAGKGHKKSRRRP